MSCPKCGIVNDASPNYDKLDQFHKDLVNPLKWFRTGVPDFNKCPNCGRAIG